MPKESLWAFSEQMKEELAGQLSPILDEREAWLSVRAAIRGTAAEPISGRSGPYKWRSFRPKMSLLR